MDLLQKKEKAKKNIRFYSGCILILLAFYASLYIVKNKYAPETLVKKGLNSIQQANTQSVNMNKKVIGFLSRKNNVTWRQLKRYSVDYKGGIIVLRGDSLVFWNNNLLSIRKASKIEPGKPAIIFMDEDPIVASKKINGNYQVISFVNLNNNKIPYGIKIEQGKHNGKNHYVVSRFGITIKVDKEHIPPLITGILFLLYLLVITCAAFTIKRIAYSSVTKKRPTGKKRMQIGFFILGILILRVIIYFIGLPEIFFHSFWHNTIMADVPGWVTPSDLLVNVILFLIVLLEWKKIIKEKPEKTGKLSWPKIMAAELLLLSVPLVLYELTRNIMQNGVLVVYPDNAYFGREGFINLILMLGVNFILYLWTETFNATAEKNGIRYKKIIWTLTLTTIIVGFTGLWDWHIVLMTYLVVLLLISIIKYIPRTKKPYFHSVLALFVLSLTATWFLNINEQQGRKAHQQYTANVLTQKKDPYLQYLLHNKAKEILKDKNIAKILNSGTGNKEQAITQYFNRKYFHGFLPTYTKQITLCEPEQQLEIQPENAIVNCNTFFENMGGDLVDSAQNYTLSLINNTTESIYYLARLHFKNVIQGRIPVNLYIEFYTNRIPKGLGYPELLQNKGTADLHLSGYSFAYYEKGKLEYKFGDFLFPIDLADFKSAPTGKFFNKGGYSHYILPLSKTEKVIVSRPNENLSNKLLPFSLLFIMSGIVLLLFVTIKYGKKIRETFRYSFSTRLQLTIFTALMLVYGMLTVIILYYFNANNRETITNNLKEKTHSVMIELQHELSPMGHDALKNRQQIQSYLQKLSMVFFSDINLYTREGTLLVSSRPEIFNRNLQSRLINPKAYFEIEKQHKLFFLGIEKIKQVLFYSSYAPFIQANGKEAGIINLPYFARQSELQRTYYQMMANLINLFVITGLLGMLLMIYLSRLLTKPLKVLQEKIGAVSIEKQNEKIEWNREDEIGKLVEAYNQMVIKLEESARLLEDSARDKAWREMARQIAHEIRNPLTPMKLNVQYLQKVYQTNDPAFGEKFEIVSKSLIDQIETLNDVVTMFSDFSKTEKQAEGKTDLIKTLKSSITLFKKSYALTIRFWTNTDRAEVRVPNRDLLRIFNNLLKNAVQSMEDRKEKIIETEVNLSEEKVEIKITDNGRGISHENEKHVFQPYFTTKTKGTGLGLAIVKNLITTYGGDIRFVSHKGKGTTFILTFPLVQ